MTIQQIKERLSIRMVLSPLRLKPKQKRNAQLSIPRRQKASMRIYDKTNTAYCFAGSCKVESVDVIDFIMHQEKLVKREAILKAKSMCNQFSIKTLPQNSPQMKKENPQTSFKRYHKAYTITSPLRNIAKLDVWIGDCWRLDINQDRR